MQSICCAIMNYFIIDCFQTEVNKTGLAVSLMKESKHGCSASQLTSVASLNKKYIKCEFDFKINTSELFFSCQHRMARYSELLLDIRLSFLLKVLLYFERDTFLYFLNIGRFK